MDNDQASRPRRIRTTPVSVRELRTPEEQARRSAYVSPADTDAATSNSVAKVVSDVWTANFGQDSYVPFSVRYGIAHEVQRRLLNGQLRSFLSEFQSPDYYAAKPEKAVADLVRALRRYSLWKFFSDASQEWEYAIVSSSGEHLWPLSGCNLDEPTCTTREACIEALGNHDPDFWDGDEKIMRRHPPTSWEAVPSDGD